MRNSSSFVLMGLSVDRSIEARDQENTLLFQAGDAEQRLNIEQWPR